MQLVSADIGGTHARFALATIAADGTIALGEPVVLDSKAHASFETAWTHFREVHAAAHPGAPLPADVSLALAGPVERPEITFASIPHWQIQRAGLEARMGVARIALINDFGAMGHAVAIAATIAAASANPGVM